MGIEKKEFLSCKFKVEKAESSGDTGYIKGYASIFGNVDQGGDVMAKGAFKRTIKNRNGVVPMLLDHDPASPAGYSKVSEDEKGLFFESELKLHDPRVRQRYELAKMSIDLGAPMGKSFGYSTVDSEYQKTNDANHPTIRLLKEVKLYETSLVTFPMNEAAGVTGAKAQAWAQLFDRLQKTGYDEEKIKKALEILLGEPPAAIQTDSEILHSVDNLIQKLKA